MAMPRQWPLHPSSAASIAAQGFDDTPAGRSPSTNLAAAEFQDGALRPRIWTIDPLFCGSCMPALQADLVALPFQSRVTWGNWRQTSPTQVVDRRTAGIRFK